LISARIEGDRIVAENLGITLEGLETQSLSLSPSDKEMQSGGGGTFCGGLPSWLEE
jgi:hypothetical protein